MPATYLDSLELTISISSEELAERGVIGCKALNTAVWSPADQLALPN